MSDPKEQVQAYILQAYAAGQTVDVIADQLRSAGWHEADLQAAFAGAQSQLSPDQIKHDGQAPASTGTRRSRVGTGFKILAVSFALLRGNRYLLRYMVMSGVWIFTIVSAVIAIYYMLIIRLYDDEIDFFTTHIKIEVYLLSFLAYLLIYFVSNYYAAGLTANLLDIFKGQNKGYRTYMSVARSKIGAIFVFSLLSATVGMLLQFVIERIRFVGWLITWLFGAAWSLGTMFVVPLIVHGDKPNGVSEIKQSFSFFKQTWGQSISAKAGLNLPLFIVQIALMTPFTVLFIIAFTLGLPGIISVCIMYYILSLMIAVFGSFSNSILNTAMYYYATTHEVPPGFSKELLNRVFVKRRRRWFHRKPIKTATT